jgi:hypothetical protein
MKRVLLTVAVALLIPSIVYAVDPTVGVYFEHGHQFYTPTPYVPFYAALYIVQPDPDVIYQVTGIEYSLEILDGFGNPAAAALTIIVDDDGWPWQFTGAASGDPYSGHAATYFPPMSGYPYGYSKLVQYDMILIGDCFDWTNLTINVVEDPRSGFLRGTYAPDNDKFPCVGLTSIICPADIGVEEESWGAIKSMYK